MLSDHKIRDTARVCAGAALTFVVSCATAAMVTFVPEKPVAGNVEILETGRLSANDYVQLHEARATAVPNYMNIGVTKGQK